MRIDPMTSGTMRVRVLDADADPIVGATVTAMIRHPMGRMLATALALTDVGGGEYELTIDPAWSTGVRGEPVPGKYHALVTAVYPGGRHTINVAYDVNFASE